jgi:hypothetical protein
MLTYNLDLRLRCPGLNDTRIDDRRVDDGRIKDWRFGDHLHRQKRQGEAFDWRRIETRVPQPFENQVRIHIVATRHLRNRYPRNTRLLRWSHIVGQFGSVVKVYSAV